MQGETLRRAFGARLKALRKQKNWAQTELGRADQGKLLAASADRPGQRPGAHHVGAESGAPRT